MEHSNPCENLYSNQQRSDESKRLSSGSQDNSIIEDQVTAEIGDAEYVQYLPLFRAADDGDLEATKRFLKCHPNALVASISSRKETVLHIATVAGHVHLVQYLVNKIPTQDLALGSIKNTAAISFAAAGGITKIAHYMVRKNRDLVRIEDQYGNIPVVVASINGHKDMVRYLYAATPVELLSPDAGKHGALLLTTCILAEIYDIALDLLRHYRELAVAIDTDGDSAFGMLAQKPSSFLSGSGLSFWQRWIYSCIHVQWPHALSYTKRDIERPHEGASTQQSMISKEINQAMFTSLDFILQLLWHSLRLFVPAIKHIYDKKKKHVQALDLLRCLCQEISLLNETQFKPLGVYPAIFDAVGYGIVEFVIEILKSYPDAVWCYDGSRRGIFLYAAAQRQEKVFSLLYRMGVKKNTLASRSDKYQNNMLHQVALLAPSSRLDCVSGAALQMQWELQWYKEVESIVQPKNKEMENKDGKTPRILFSECHKELVSEGEKWMKDTATSCTVVAALIVTIMFAAAFTVPGGFNGDTGVPLYLDHKYFMVFIVSDALSLFSSSTSLLMFLGILTSRYREEDFLKSLPTKLIIGLSTLFFSIATMMITFGTTLVIMLHEKLSWVSIPIILLASIPVTLFALMQFPLLVEIFLSTYGPGIFDKPRKSTTQALLRRLCNVNYTK